MSRLRMPLPRQPVISIPFPGPTISTVRIATYSLIARRLKLHVPDAELRKGSVWTYYRGAYRDSGRDEGATIILPATAPEPKEGEVLKDEAGIEHRIGEVKWAAHGWWCKAMTNR